MRSRNTSSREHSVSGHLNPKWWLYIPEDLRTNSRGSAVKRSSDYRELGRRHLFEPCQMEKVGMVFDF